MINEKLAQDFKKLGIKSDDTILMHSALSSLGPLEGGAETVIDTLLYVLSEGTLLIPSLSFGTVTAENPVFSVKETPSCVGKIGNALLKRPNVIRSVHPTHSVCGIGKRAEEMLSQHLETDTPAGEKSPFRLLRDVGGKVLMLGCGLRPNTSMHAVEELTCPWYLLRDERRTYTIIDADGKTFEKSYKVHYFPNVIQRYDRLENLMEITSGKVLEATCHLIDAPTMWEVGHKALLENENYFIDIRED